MASFKEIFDLTKELKRTGLSQKSNVATAKKVAGMTGPKRRQTLDALKTKKTLAKQGVVAVGVKGKPTVKPKSTLKRKGAVIRKKK